MPRSMTRKPDFRLDAKTKTSHQRDVTAAAAANQKETADMFTEFGRRSPFFASLNANGPPPARPCPALPCATLSLLLALPRCRTDLPRPALRHAVVSCDALPRCRTDLAARACTLRRRR